MEWSTVVFWLLLIGGVLYIISVYNRLVALKNRYQNAFAQIEVQLKRRYDLIPNLVETARNAAVAGLSAAAANPANRAAIEELAGAEGALVGALGKLNVVVEAYPELKANENMMQLTEELTSTENRVSFARQSFNDSVTAYNTYKQGFPPVLLAGLFGHGSNATLLEFADSAAIQEAPKVSF